jgi:hypothetical protein
MVETALKKIQLNVHERANVLYFMPNRTTLDRSFTVAARKVRHDQSRDREGAGRSPYYAVKIAGCLWLRAGKLVDWLLAMTVAQAVRFRGEMSAPGI